MYKNVAENKKTGTSGASNSQESNSQELDQLVGVYENESEEEQEQQQQGHEVDQTCMPESKFYKGAELEDDQDDPYPKGFFKGVEPVESVKEENKFLETEVFDENGNEFKFDDTKTQPKTKTIGLHSDDCKPEKQLYRSGSPIVSNDEIAHAKTVTMKSLFGEKKEIPLSGLVKYVQGLFKNPKMKTHIGYLILTMFNLFKNTGAISSLKNQLLNCSEILNKRSIETLDVFLSLGSSLLTVDNKPVFWVFFGTRNDVTQKIMQDFFCTVRGGSESPFVISNVTVLGVTIHVKLQLQGDILTCDGQSTNTTNLRTTVKNQLIKHATDTDKQNFKSFNTDEELKKKTETELKQKKDKKEQEERQSRFAQFVNMDSVQIDRLISLSKLSDAQLKSLETLSVLSSSQIVKLLGLLGE